MLIQASSTICNQILFRALFCYAYIWACALVMHAHVNCHLSIEVLVGAVYVHVLLINVSAQNGKLYSDKESKEN